MHPGHKDRSCTSNGN
uniref:Uncharacterized protein n=1 Tax=Arundo donax TaxID=35708 RepID=A0A0A9RH15_ARUDO